MIFSLEGRKAVGWGSLPSIRIFDSRSGARSDRQRRERRSCSMEPIYTGQQNRHHTGCYGFHPHLGFGE